MNTKIQNDIARAGLWTVGIFILALLAAFLGYILYKGLPVLNWHFIFGKSSDIMAGGGVGAQLFNSFYMLFLSMAVSIPLAIGAGIYLAEYARENRLTKCIRLSVESLATVPSIVLGLFGMIIFVNEMHLGFSILGGSLTLVLLNLPMLVRVTEESIKTVPKSYEEASLALGATKWQTIYKVILRVASPRIMTAVIFGMARAFGEALAVQMVIGNAVLMPANLVSPSATLTSQLTSQMGNTVMGTLPNNALWSLALLLLIMSLVFNFLVRLIGKRGQK